MPKAFLLTNKRYRIWQQINETFRKQKLLQQLDKRRKSSTDEGFADVTVADDMDMSTDYSKYTEYTDDEGIYHKKTSSLLLLNSIMQIKSIVSHMLRSKTKVILAFYHYFINLFFQFWHTRVSCACICMYFAYLYAKRDYVLIKDIL